MRVHIDGGGNITAVGDELGAPYVEFGINAPPDLTGYTVTGTAPNRLLKKAGETVADEIYTPTAPAPTGGGGGGPSTPPGQAAHYIGTWDVAVAYAAGECVRQWDAGSFGWQLCQAKKATTGVSPTLGADNADWTFIGQHDTPLILWGTENPNTTGNIADDGGVGLAAPVGSLYLWREFGVLFFTSGEGTEDATDQHINGQHLNGSWVPPSTIDDSSIDFDVPGWNVSANAIARRTGLVGTGDTLARCLAHHEGASGSADVRSEAHAIGAGLSALAGAVAIAEAADVHEAHILPTADAFRAFNDIKADLIFTDNTEGPVIHDQSDGHTYRIVSTAGVLSTVLVT